MKYLLLFLIISSNLFSQANVDEPIKFDFNELLTEIKLSEETSNINGKVVVNIFVSKQGKLTKTEIVSSEDKRLEPIIIDALKKYNKFTPARKNGEFVDSWIKMPFVFSAKDSKNTVSYYNANPELEEIKLDKNPEIDINKLMSKVVYPKYAIENKLEGKVIASILINEEGEAEEIKISSSENPVFNDATKDAIKAYGKFIPAEKDNQKVKSWVSIPFNYALTVIEEKIDESNKNQVNAKFDLEKLMKLVKYPEEARKQEIEGKVIVKVLIDDKGKFTKYEIEHSDNKALNEAALNAVKKYGKAESPATVNGKATASWVFLPIQFRLK